MKQYFSACHPGKKKRTQETENGAARRLNEFFGEMDVDKIKGADVVQFRLKSDSGPVRDARILSVGSAAFNWAISDLGMDLTNPFHGRLMSKKDRQALPPPRKRSLTKAEVSALRMAAGPKVFRDIIDFAVNTGMRQTEITRMRWCYLSENHVLIPPEESKNNRYSKRALNNTAKEIIKRQGFLGDPNRFVFLSPTGREITRNDISLWFNQAAEKAGIEDVRFHDLRRTCGTWMLAHRASLETVKKQLGHLDIRTTQSNYATEDFQLSLDAVRAMEED